MEDVLVSHTDGGCSPNPGTGGYSFIIDHSTKRYKGWGKEEFTTNNRMELMGVIDALRFIREHDLFSGYKSIKIISDSKYAVDGLNKWIDGWTKRGWKTAQREPVKNTDLWKILIQYKELYPITMEWIKGHNEHPLNEECDRMATKARKGII